MPTPNAATQCPFCQEPNGCMVQSNEPCWCFNEVIPSELLKLVPPTAKYKRCICAKCLKHFQENPIAFKARQ